MDNYLRKYCPNRKPSLNLKSKIIESLFMQFEIFCASHKIKCLNNCLLARIKSHKVSQHFDKLHPPENFVFRLKLIFPKLTSAPDVATSVTHNFVM